MMKTYKQLTPATFTAGGAAIETTKTLRVVAQTQGVACDDDDERQGVRGVSVASGAQAAIIRIIGGEG